MVFRMFRNGRLDEQRRDAGVDSRRQQRSRHLAPADAELLRFVRHGDRVVIHHADDGRVLVLEPDPVLHRAQVVSNMQLARGLDSTEDSRHRVKV
jgi:hypothetical protein